MRHSIAWRMVLPVPVVTIAAVLVAWLALPSYIASNAVDDAIQSARQTAAQFKTLRGYYTENVAAKAIKGGALKLDFDHRGRDDRIPLPATVIHDLSDLLKQQGMFIKLYSPYPFANRQDRVLDDFAKEAWSTLSKDPTGIYARRAIVDGKETVRVAIGDTMTAQVCVACHNARPDSPKHDWKLGDLRGVLEFDNVIEPQLARGGEMTRNILLGIAGAGLLLALISVLVSRGAIGALRRIATAMRRLAGGDKASAIPGLDRRDEIGEMAASVEVFRNAAIELETLQGQAEATKRRIEMEKKSELAKLAYHLEASVRSIVQAVSSAAGQLQSLATAMSAAADQTTGQATAVAGAAAEASSNVQAVASATEELSGSITEIGRQVMESSRITGQAVEETGRADAQMRIFAETAQKIGDVVKLINAIAGQTNLLALNATIEAARAGEAGKGFAVVASEVKSLANQTAKATEDISAQVGAIQSASSGAVQAIQGITTTVSRVNEIATAIAAAVEEQGAATAEIARNVQQASSGTSQVSATINGVSQAAGETRSAAEQVRTAAAELVQQGTRLEAEVNNFLATLRAA